MNFRNLFLAGLGAGSLCVFGSCETSPTSAFPTAEKVAARAGGGNAAIATLERGRKIYTTSCTECHVARPIANYTVARWRHYVGIMAPRAGLAKADQAALETYVVAARESLPAPAAATMP